MEKKSLIARRLICDHVDKFDGVVNVSTSKRLLAFATTARNKYEKYTLNRKLGSI
ncbi:hypothetical protein CHS0354_015594, partial [Potamilus streckersoni]